MRSSLCFKSLFAVLLQISLVQAKISSQVCTVLEVSGQRADQPEHDAMGHYAYAGQFKKRAYWKQQFGSHYMFFNPAKAQWWVASTLSSSASPELYIAQSTSSPLTTEISGVWHVKSGHSSSQRYITALNIRVACPEELMESKNGRKIEIEDDSQSASFSDAPGSFLRRKLAAPPIVFSSAAALLIVFAAWTGLTRQVNAAVKDVSTVRPQVLKTDGSNETVAYQQYDSEQIAHAHDTAGLLDESADVA